MRNGGRRAARVTAPPALLVAYDCDSRRTAHLRTTKTKQILQSERDWPHTVRLNLSPNGSMFEIAFQGVDPVGVTQFLQCLVLYLAHPFTGHVELIAEFFQCVFGNRIDAEA